MEKYKRENPGATDADIDVNSLLPDPAKKASGSHRPRVPVPMAHRQPRPVRHNLGNAALQGLAAGNAQALRHAQGLQLAAAAGTQARMAAVRAGALAEQAAQLAQMRRPVVPDPGYYGRAFQGLLLLAICLSGISMGMLITSRA